MIKAYLEGSKNPLFRLYKNRNPLILRLLETSKEGFLEPSTSCADHTLSERLSTEDHCGSRKQFRSEHDCHPHGEPHVPEEKTA